MKIIYNKIIPFKGFLAINMFGVLFVRKEFKKYGLKDSTINHEKIYTEQMKEMGYVFFYLWYFIEWLVRLCINYKTAYRMISFEQETYGNQENMEYLKGRKHYSWWKYLKNI